MGQNIVVTGMVLKVMPIGDYDRRITLLTKENGVAAATSALFGLLAPFANAVILPRSFVSSVIGKGGAMLKKIGSNARYEIERLLEEQVNLKLWEKLKKTGVTAIP